MKFLSQEKYDEYVLKNKTRYIFSPMAGIAFRDTYENGKARLFGKGKGRKEVEIDFLNEDFEKAEMVKCVMTREEYDNY